MTRALTLGPLIVSKLATIVVFIGTIATAQPQFGIAMYGSPALDPDFKSLPYANPEAPHGGKLILAESGGFDSMNPYILKGRAPYGIRAHVVESLMGRNWDEPFSLYGLLAETIETGPNREWVEFTLRPEARFSDGTPVTVEDVLWSFETLGTKGHPRYSYAWNKIAKGEQTGPRSVRFDFNQVDLELPLILGLRPILKKANWADRRFEGSSLDIITGSGPYIIDSMEPGRFIKMRRNPDYWGKDLPFNAGRHNLDVIQYDYYGDGGIVFEAFKAGEASTYREWNAGQWNTGYTFPAAVSGDIVQSEIEHQRPTGMKGFVFNTRKEKFQDWRVREALILAFNYEFINRTINGEPQSRIASYFSNSVLAMAEGPASGKVKDNLTPYTNDLLPGALDGYTLLATDGSERNRKGLRKAKNLLQDAGWTIQDGALKNQNGQDFGLEILLKAGSSENEAIANIYTDALKRLGITTQITIIDSAQYKERTNLYDFDITYFSRGLSLSPGNEQRLYWGADGVTKPGTRNLMGMDNPAAEAMIDKMLTSNSQNDFVAAVKALDRILTSGRYVIPFWSSNISRLAHLKELHFPDNLPMHGDWTGFLPDVWWYQD